MLVQGHMNQTHALLDVKKEQQHIVKKIDKLFFYNREAPADSEDYRPYRICCMKRLASNAGYEDIVCRNLGTRTDSGWGVFDGAYPRGASFPRAGGDVALPHHSR